MFVVVVWNNQRAVNTCFQLHRNGHAGRTPATNASGRSFDIRHPSRGKKQVCLSLMKIARALVRSPCGHEQGHYPVRC